MEIPLLILVLQIRFNAALNNRGYSSNPVIPSPPFVNSGQTRRLAETDTSLQLSSRGLPDSDEESESGYSGSFEDYSYRLVRQLQRHPNQRKNEYLRYKSPGGRINSINQVQSLTSDPYLRQPYLRNGVSNLRPDQISQNYRKANDDSSLEVSSLESTNSEDASRLGEEATYLRSLLSLMELQNNRKGQSRKYYGQENSLNIGVSPIDTLNVDEDDLPDSLNNRRNNNPDNRQVDSILLVADHEDKSDEIPIENSILKSPELTGLRYNKSYKRNYDPITRRFNKKSNKNAGLDSPLNDNNRKLTVLRLASLEDLESPLLRSGNNRKNNHRNFLRLSLSPDNKLTLDKGVTPDLSEILSETLGGLHLAPVNLRRTDLPNNKYSRRNNNGLNVEENSLRLGRLHVPKPASPLGRYRGNLRTHGNHIRQLLKRLPPLRRYRNPANLSSNISLRTHGNHTRLVLKKILDEDTAKNVVSSLRTDGNHTRKVPKTESDGDAVNTIEHGLRTHGNHTRQELKKLFDKDTAKILVPYHESKSKKLLNNKKHENQNYNRKDGVWPDEFSLDTLFAFRNENNLADGLTNQDNLSIEPSLLTSSGEIPPKDDDKLHLEFPWNDSLSPDDNKGKLLLRTHKRNGKSKDTFNLEIPWNVALSSDSAIAKSKLRTDEKKDNPKDSDTLYLEFPWNGHLISNAGKGKSQLRNDDDKNDESKDITEALHLEFPWNDALSPDGDKSTSQLRIDGKKDETEDTTDTLQLEFPWNDALGPDSDRGKSKLRINEQKDEINDTNDTLKLEFPWNDALGPDSDRGKSKLRINEQKDEINDTNDTLKLEFPWNDALGPDSDRGKSKLKINEQKDKINDTLKLKFPWNDTLSSNSDKENSKLRTDEQKDVINDTLKLEFPWNGALSSSSDKENSKLRTDEQKDKTKNTTEKLNLEPPWNGALSPDGDKGKSKLISDEQIDETKNTTDTLNLEFPWNDILSLSSDKSKKTLRSKYDTKDAIHLEYPWNGQLSSDSNETGGIKSQSYLRNEKDRQNKDPQDDLKLEFPWNGQTSPDKLRLPDPFYIHPYLRNRNVNKHPSYFRQSYDMYSRGRRLDNRKNRRSDSRYRQSKRRRYDDLDVIGLNSRSSEEDSSDLISFPEDRRPNRPRSKENNTPKHTSH